MSIHNKNYDWVFCEIPDRNLLGDCWRLIIEERTWYIYYFLEAAGNNTRTFSQFNVVVTCFAYFNNNNNNNNNNNMFSLKSLPNMDKFNFFSGLISKLHTCILFAMFLLWLHSNIQIFIKHQLRVKSSQIDGFVTVCPIKYWPPKTGG